MVIRFLTKTFLFVFIAIATIGGCGGGGDGNGGDGEAANPLFSGTHRGLITTTQGGQTLEEFLTLTLFVESPLDGTFNINGSVGNISGDAVGDSATFSGDFDGFCAGTVSGTLELIPEDTILYVAQGSDCDGTFSSTGNLTRCFTPEEISASDCPAEAVLEVCEPYFCEFCSSEVAFCGSFLLPAGFSCEAIDCMTIACDGGFVDIMVINGSLSGTIVIDGEFVPFFCFNTMDI